MWRSALWPLYWPGQRVFPQFVPLWGLLLCCECSVCSLLNSREVFCTYFCWTSPPVIPTISFLSLQSATFRGWAACCRPPCSSTSCGKTWSCPTCHSRKIWFCDSSLTSCCFLTGVWTAFPPDTATGILCILQYLFFLIEFLKQDHCSVSLGFNRRKDLFLWASCGFPLYFHGLDFEPWAIGVPSLEKRQNLAVRELSLQWL